MLEEKISAGGLLGWAGEAFEGDTFFAALWPDISVDGSHPNHQIDDETMQCNYAQKATAPSRQSTYWWSNEIANLLTVCSQTRRLYQATVLSLKGIHSEE